VYEGPGFHEAAVALDAMPVLVRDGAVLPRVPVDDGVRSTDDLVGRPWTLHAYGAAADDTTVSLRGFDGTITTAHVRGSDVTSEGSQAVGTVVRHA